MTVAITVALGALIALWGVAYAALGARATPTNTTPTNTTTAGPIAPPAQVAAATTAPTASPAPAAPATSPGNWDKIAACESGGAWNTNTGNGYYGGLQFNAATWHNYGGSGLPHQASKATQITIAEKVLAEQGWGAWPVCSRKAGLR
jgi:hypothetical protein